MSFQTCQNFADHQLTRFMFIAEAGRQVTVLRVSGAAADHPVSPSFPEGQYLSALLVAVF
jgi:23S rRNA G2069 N7-methylase RlmK/C1962 C5-methylase RlmI